MSLEADRPKQALKPRQVPMHVLRVIGMRLRIRSRSIIDDAIPENMLKILKDLRGREEPIEPADDTNRTQSLPQVKKK